MAKSSTFDNDWLKLIFNATPIANIADNAAASPLTNLFVALHTADPTASGNQTSSEITTAAYGGYARSSVARTTGGWTVTGNSVSPAANISFPASTGGTGATITFFSVGTAASGTGKILYSGPVSPNIVLPAAAGPGAILVTGSAITES